MTGVAHVDPLEGRKPGELQELINRMDDGRGGTIVLGLGTHEGFSIGPKQRSIVIEGESRSGTEIVGPVTTNAGKTRLHNLTVRAGETTHGIKFLKTTTLLEHCALEHVNIGWDGGVPAAEPNIGLHIASAIMFEARNCSFILAKSSNLFVENVSDGTVNLDFVNCGFAYPSGANGRCAELAGVINCHFRSCDFEGGKAPTGGSAVWGRKGNQFVTFDGCNFENNGDVPTVIGLDLTHAARIANCNLNGGTGGGKKAMRAVFLQTSNHCELSGNIVHTFDPGEAIVGDVNSHCADARGNKLEDGLAIRFHGKGCRVWP